MEDLATRKKRSSSPDGANAETEAGDRSDGGAGCFHIAAPHCRLHVGFGSVNVAHAQAAFWSHGNVSVPARLRNFGVARFIEPAEQVKRSIFLTSSNATKEQRAAANERTVCAYNAGEVRLRMASITTGVQAPKQIRHKNTHRNDTVVTFELPDITSFNGVSFALKHTSCGCF